MSLIQIPKIEYITLEQFIPKWTKNSLGLIQGFKDKRGLDLGSLESCIVGEVYGFTRDYCDSKICGCCKHFSIIALDLRNCKDYEKFDNFKLNLFTHILEAHPQLIITK